MNDWGLVKAARAYFSLTKSGIIIFALLSAVAGAAIGHPVGTAFEPVRLLLMLIALYCVCAGSFTLNQAQEWRLDKKMKRTWNRPIPQGLILPWQGYWLAFLLLGVGLLGLYAVNPLTAGLALFTVALYNGVYTLLWKPRLAFAAVPGAVPGAMPVVIGYSFSNPAIFSPECVYLFLVMFLWQMPHFWCLALRFKNDYKSGGVPVLPTSLGASRTLYHIGLYIFSYVGVAMASPWFLQVNVLYLFLVVPISIKLLVEFFRYFRTQGHGTWISFFVWVNMSMLVFLGAPVFDKWFYWIMSV